MYTATVPARYTAHVVLDNDTPGGIAGWHYTAVTRDELDSFLARCLEHDGPFTVEITDWASYPPVTTTHRYVRGRE